MNTPDLNLRHLILNELQPAQLQPETLRVVRNPRVSWVVRFMLLVSIICGLGVVAAHAQTVDKLQGLCTRGGQVINTAGAASAQKAEMVVPSCTVTIYVAGTLTPATIYSDRASTPTPKANPFTATTAGEWFFYATSGRYDIRLSGGTGAGAYPSPVTYGDMWIVNPSSSTPVTQAYTTITKDQVAITQRSILEIPGSTGQTATDSTPLVSSVLASPRIPVGVYNVVEAFHASGIPDAGTGSISSSSSTLTMNTFPSGYLMTYYWKVGQGVLIVGAGVAGADLKTTVTAVGSTTITIATPASTTVSAVRVQHDDTAAIQAAINNVANGNTHIYFPEGGYLVTSAITLPTITEGRSLILSGTGKSGSTIYYQGLGSLFTQLDTATTIDSLEVKDMAFATSTPGAYSTVRPTVNQGSAFDFSYSQVVNFPKWTNLRIIGWGRWGIFCANCQGGWISNTVFRSNAQGHLGFVGPETLLQAGAAEANVNSIRDSQFDLAPNISNTDTSLTGLGMAIGSYTLTSAAPMFSSTHEGRLVRVTGAGVGGGDLIALVKTYISTTSVTLSANNQTGSTLSSLTGTMYKSNFGSIYLHRANVTKLSSLTIQGNYSGSTRNEFAIRAENSYGLEISNLWIEDTGGGSGHDIELLNAPAATIKGYKSNADSTAATGDTHGGNLYLRNGSTVTIDGMFAENPTKHFDLDTTSSLIIDASTLSTSDNAFNTFDQSRDRITLGPTVRYKTEAATSPSQRNTLAMYDDPLVNTVVNGRFEDGAGGMTGWTDSNPTFHTLVTGTGRFNRYQRIDTSALADNATQATAFSQTVSIPDNYPSRLWTLGFDLYVESFGTTPTTNRYVTITVTASGAGVGYDDFKVQSTNTSNLALARWERIQYSLFLPTGTGRTFQIIVNTSRGPTSPIVRLANFRLSPGRAVNGSNDQPITELQGGVIRNYLDFVGQTAPAVSAAGRGRIYVDTSGTFQCSENGGAYVACGSGGGGSATTDYFGAINVKKAPYSCVGDDSANDTTCLQSAITAAAAVGGQVIYLPPGTYRTNAKLTVPGGVTIRGAGKLRSFIHGTANDVVVDLVQGSSFTAFFGPELHDLGVLGSSSGSSQIVVRATDASVQRDVVIENVYIANGGSHGLYVGNTFSSNFKGIYSTGNTGYNFFYDAPNMPSNYFSGLYSGDISATSPAGYYIRQGTFSCFACNGVNTNLGGTGYNFIIGGKSGDIYGNGSAYYAKVNLLDTNIEGAKTAGILNYPGSVTNIDGVSSFVGLSASSGSYIAIDYDTDASLTPENSTRGYISDTVVFSNSPASFYANSQPIRSDGTPPLSTQGRGPQIAGGGAAGIINTYYNTATSRTEKLNRADGFAPVVDITTTTSFTSPGANAYRINCAAPCTLSLPSPNFYENGNQIITIFNISATGVNVTINANGGAGVNGSSYVMSIQGQSVQLYPDFTSLDWRVVGNRIGAGSTDYYSIFDSAHSITQTGSKLSNSGSNLLIAGGVVFSTDNSVSIGASGSNRPAQVYVGTAVTSPSFYNVGGGACYRSGSATPEGAETCEPGSIYLRTNGTWYIKSSGSGNTGWSLVNTAGTATLTSTYVGYGNGSNVLTGTSDLAYNTTTKTLTVTNGSGASSIFLTGTSDTSKINFGAGSVPGNQGGVVFPFVGGGNSSGPGIWWASSAAYGSMSGIYLNNGFTFQGANSTHDHVKFAEGTGNSSNGTVRWDFQPSGSLLSETFSSGGTAAAHIIEDLTITSTGTAAANFGTRTNTTIENGAGSNVLAIGIEKTWAVATASAETGKWEVFARNQGSTAARSFTVEGLQNYGTVNNLGNKTGSFTVDFSLGNDVTATATGNWTTITFSNIKAGGMYSFKITQDATGGRTWTPPTVFKYPGGVAGNILTTTANAVDVFYCKSFDGTNLYCNGTFDVKNP